MINLPSIRNDFPIFSRYPDLIYLDNAATTHKSRQVINAMADWYAYENGPVHRGVYGLSERATQRYEQARATIAAFIGANAHEVVFTAGTTHGINMVAYAWAMKQCGPGDQIIISPLEHHSNIVPWQRVCQVTGATLSYMILHDDGTIDYDHLASMVSSHTRLISCVHVSNTIGTVVDVERMRVIGQSVGARFLLDGAQSIGYYPIDVKRLGVDFFVFSGHKIGGPTGVGILYVAESIHHQLDPYLLGGGMVRDVSLYHATWAPMPQLLEAGTPAVAQAIGLEAAINYVSPYTQTGELIHHTAQLCALLMRYLKRMPRVTVLGSVEHLSITGHIVSFTIDGIHAHDVAAYLDQYQVAVRAGTHCAQVAAVTLRYQSTVRVSFFIYNNQHDVLRLVELLEQLMTLF